MSKRLKRLWRTLPVIIGVVLIWRGMWTLIDLLETTFLGRHSKTVALASIAAGLLILYFHRHRSNEEEHLI